MSLIKARKWPAWLARRCGSHPTRGDQARKARSYLTALSGVALGTAVALPLAASPNGDADTIHAYCVATDIDQGRTFYSDVFPVQRRRYYDNHTTFAIAFARHVDARWDASTGYERCWHDELALDVRMERDRRAAEQQRAIRAFEPVFVHWRP